MTSEAGQQLRRLEREYNRTVRQFIARSARLAGSDMLVLGSGSSKEIIPLLNRGVTSVTFVDVSQVALDRLRTNLETGGVTAFVDVEFVCDDAWKFLQSIDEATYDIILATKCIGLILAAEPHSRKVVHLLDMVEDALKPDGSFFGDHHTAFSYPDVLGRRVIDVVPPSLLDLATIGGRYSGDRCYSLTVRDHGLTLVGRFALGAAEHGVQSWELHHFRAPAGAGPRQGAPLSSHRVVPPKPISLPALQQFDPVVDGMIPINNKGIKRVPTPSDVGAFDISVARLKLDGVAGVLALDGDHGVFSSPVATFVIDLNCAVQPPLVLAAEMVPERKGGAVVCPTGAISVGGARCDPLDFTALAPLVPILDRLGPSGILANVPELVRYLDSDSVVLPLPFGDSLRLPVDGVQVRSGGRDGVFFKATSHNTIDAVPAELEGLIGAAAAATGLKRGWNVKLPEDQSFKVWEFTLGEGTGVWIPLRPRLEKTRSDTLGAVICTLLARYGAEDVGIGNTTAEVIRKVTR